MNKTNPEIIVLPATPEHVRLLASCLRKEDALAAERTGIPAHRALWRSYKASLYAKTAFIDGKIAAMWGITGTYLGEKGTPWLLISENADEFPFKVAFRYRQELREMLRLFPILEEWVDAKHDKSLRMMKMMGFDLGEKVMAGEHMFIRAQKRA
jgi:hypothetical protein